VSSTGRITAQAPQPQQQGGGVQAAQAPVYTPQQQPGAPCAVLQLHHPVSARKFGMSDSFLSQEEVDALLEGVTGERQKSDSEEVDEGSVRNYDISSQERIVRGRMPTMEIVNERFARNFRIGLFNFIRRSPEVSVGTVSVQRYSAFLRRLAVPTNFNIVAIRPLRGNGLIVCEPSLVFGIIDTLYGGAGRLQTRIEGRDFSATEQRVINRLVDVISEEYKKAWHGIYPLELAYQRSEMQPQFANIATPSEIVVSTAFQLEIGDVSGSIHICMPYATMEPIRDILYSSTQGDSMEVDRRWVKVLTREIQSADVTLVAELARADATVEQLLAMKPGDFIELDRQPRIRASIGGVPIFECQYGTHNNTYAIRIEPCLRSGESNWTGEKNGN
jgi:flagellar motor switch protein FliM